MHINSYDASISGGVFSRQATNSLPGEPGGRQSSGDEKWRSGCSALQKKAQKPDILQYYWRLLNKRATNSDVLPILFGKSQLWEIMDLVPAGKKKFLLTMNPDI